MNKDRSWHDFSYKFPWLLPQTGSDNADAMLYSSDQRPEMTLTEQKSKNQKRWLLMGTLAASTPALFLLLKAADLAVAVSLSS